MSGFTCDIINRKHMKRNMDTEDEDGNDEDDIFNKKHMKNLDTQRMKIMMMMFFLHLFSRLRYCVS